MQSRRDFLGSVAAPIAAGSLLSPAAFPSLALGSPRGIGILAELAATPYGDDPAGLAAAARDETFWASVQQAFTADRAFVNLNNGGVSPSPRIVQESVKRNLDFSNTSTAYTMWRILEPQRETVRQRMARQWGTDTEEIAITRNSSESLQICQLGMKVEPGDEVLTTTQDYPRMITTFKQRERRDGIKLVQVKIPIPCEDPAQIVRIFEQAITPRTRILLICHVINITGQILPVRDIVAMARTKNGGIPVIVDGAHALAQFDFKISDLGCDYYGVSLHKWLCAPHGTGLLYVRKDKIRDLWPMMAADEKLDNDIRKFEEIGTHPAANFLGIADALTFHQAIGGKRREARLRYLRDYWAKPLLELPKVKLHTSLDPRFSCAIGNVQIEGVDTAELAGHLFDKYKIYVVGIKHDEFEGIRVTPSVYTTIEELDRFIDAMRKVIKDGLPASPPPPPPP
ncbi:MAG: aminotransferase class V-fold PLP-dependent enzyme [Phycisphaerales bacterium]|nr:aminotransferase class V-fold PLP-dependent enzyme [Phycisphaerales bacterium]